MSTILTISMLLRGLGTLLPRFTSFPREQRQNKRKSYLRKGEECNYLTSKANQTLSCCKPPHLATPHRSKGSRKTVNALRMYHPQKFTSMLLCSHVLTMGLFHSPHSTAPTVQPDQIPPACITVATLQNPVEKRLSPPNGKGQTLTRVKPNF